MKNRFKELLSAIGMSQTQFADKLGIHVSTVNAWVKGREPFPETRIFQICKLYNVREEWFRNGTGEMFEPGKSLDDQLCGIAKELFSKLDAKGQEAVVKVLEQIVESLGGEVKKPKDNRPAWEIINERNGRSQINLGTVNGDWRQD